MATRAIRTTSGKRRAAAPAPALGPGLHAATIELEGARAEGRATSGSSGAAFMIRTADGKRLRARLAAAMSVGLARVCLRTGRTVIVSETERGPTILGALQTCESPSVDDEGKLSVQAKDIRLSASRSLRIEAGSATLDLAPAGQVRLEGDKLVVDVAGLVRFLSARVELP